MSSGSRPRRWWHRVVAGVVGLVVGAVAGSLIANATLPSREQMHAYAADLVPPGAVMTSLGGVGGFEPFVGPYLAVADFSTPGTEVAVVAAAVREQATQLGWVAVRTEPTAAGEVQYWTRADADASVHIRNFESTEDGTIFVNYQHSPTARMLTGLAIGAAAGLVVALLLPTVVNSARRETKGGEL